MGNLKISQLTSGNPAQSSDIIPIDRSGSNFRVTAGSIAALVSGTASSSWSSPHAMLGGATYSAGVSSGVREIQNNSTMQFWLPVPVSFNRLAIIMNKITVGGSQETLDWGIYDSSGNVLASIGATAYGASATPILKNGTVKQGTVSLSAGTYWFYWASLGGGVNTTLGVYTTANVSGSTTAFAIRQPYSITGATDGSGNLINTTPPAFSGIGSSISTAMDFPIFCLNTV